jgi:hypothetical protein
MTFLSQFKAARRVSTPLVAVRTFDAKSTVDAVKTLFPPKKEGTKEVSTIPPMILWDCINGFRSVSEVGKAALASMIALSQLESVELTIPLDSALRFITNFPEDTIIFISNIHLFWGEKEIIQGLWNLRDSFKVSGNMLVALTNQGAILPIELAHDFLVLDEPLPTLEVLEGVVKNTFEYAKLDAPSKEIMEQATGALIGLPYFPAEQSTAMCLNIANDNGKVTGTLDIEGLWERKRQAINATQGLSITTGKEKLDEIGGLETVKTFLLRLLNGNDSPRCIIFSDEIEKTFAGTGTDTSGVKTELTGSMLQWTTKLDMAGVLGIGVPGAGKTQIMKAIAAEMGIPFITFDLAGMQGSLVGQSGAALRAAQSIIEAVSGGRILWVATCNSIDALPPELQARFKDGTFFFDAPTMEERISIWAIHRKAFNIPETDTLPIDKGWTGREIRECCSKAYRLKMNLSEASQYIVPVTVSNAGIIDNLRRQSSGKYLSASHTGIYRYEEEVKPFTGHVLNVEQGRKMRES